jgi:hypothetical protein
MLMHCLNPQINELSANIDDKILPSRASHQVPMDASHAPGQPCDAEARGGNDGINISKPLQKQQIRWSS